jgi:hypothetical protein
MDGALYAVIGCQSKEQSFFEMLVSIILLYFHLLLLYYPEGTNRVSWYQKMDELSFIPASLIPSGQGISEIKPWWVSSSTKPNSR